MSLGLAVYTIVHVAISLIGIGAGLVVVAGFLSTRHLDGWTKVFLATTVATSVTGFGFPFTHFLPSHAVGIVSMIVLAVTISALYVSRLAGWWRPTYVVGSVLALYLNVFVLVVQLFLKVTALKALAPTQTEPPFAIAQGLIALLFLGLGVMSVRRFTTATPVRLDARTAAGGAVVS